MCVFFEEKRNFGFFLKATSMWNIALFDITYLARLVLDFVPIEQRRHWIQIASATEREQLFDWMIADDRIWNEDIVVALASNDNVHLLRQNKKWVTLVKDWAPFFEQSGPKCMTEYAAHVTPATASLAIRCAEFTITELNFDIVLSATSFNDDDRRSLLVHAIRHLSRRPWLSTCVEKHLTDPARMFDIAIQSSGTAVIDFLAYRFDNAFLCLRFDGLCHANAEHALLQITDPTPITSKKRVVGYCHALRRVDMLTLVARVAPLSSNDAAELWAWISKFSPSKFATQV